MRNDKDRKLANKVMGQPIRLIIYHRIYKFGRHMVCNQSSFIYMHRILAIPKSKPFNIHTFIKHTQHLRVFECKCADLEMLAGALECEMDDLSSLQLAKHVVDLKR